MLILVLVLASLVLVLVLVLEGLVLVLVFAGPVLEKSLLEDFLLLSNISAR